MQQAAADSSRDRLEVCTATRPLRAVLTPPTFCPSGEARNLRPFSVTTTVAGAAPLPLLPSPLLLLVLSAAATAAAVPSSMVAAAAASGCSAGAQPSSFSISTDGRHTMLVKPVCCRSAAQTDSRCCSTQAAA